MEENQNVLMVEISPAQDVLMKQNQPVLMEQLIPHVLMETSQFVGMEPYLENQPVKMVIDQLVRMDQLLENQGNLIVMMVGNLFALMEIALFALMELRPHPVLTEISQYA